MHDFVFLESFEPVQNLKQEVSGFVFGQLFFVFQVLQEIAFVAILHDEVEVVGRFLDVVKFDDVVVVALLEHFDLGFKKV